MMEEYFNTLLQETERRMAQLLGRMSGVGRVQVMLSLKTGPTLQPAWRERKRSPPAGRWFRT